MRIATAPVKVVLSAQEAKALDHDVHIANKVILALKKQRVPVLGAISIRGVSTGTLTMSTVNGDLVYEWTPPTPGAAQQSKSFDDEDDL
jgi:hypothetical protein